MFIFYFIIIFYICSALGANKPNLCEAPELDQAEFGSCFYNLSEVRSGTYLSLSFSICKMELHIQHGHTALRVGEPVFIVVHFLPAPQLP